MDWKQIPAAPAYEINRRGQVRRRDTRYRIVNRCRRVRLWLGDRYILVDHRALATELFAAPEPMESAQTPPEPMDLVPTVSTSMETEATAPDVEAPAADGETAPERTDGVWLPCAGLPVFEICRSGEVRHARTGEPVRTLRSAAYAHPYVHTRINGKSAHRAINVLLEETFGSGSAAAAGFTVPDLAHVHALRAALRKRTTPRGSRACHDCGKPTDNYRCNACWKRVRGYGVGDEPAEETCDAHDAL